MVLMLSGHQKQPGTPVHVNPQYAAGPSSPSLNPLSNFKFSVIGQEPSLLQRMSAAEQELQYPPSPSPSSLSDLATGGEAMPLLRPPLYDFLGHNADNVNATEHGAQQSRTGLSEGLLPGATGSAASTHSDSALLHSGPSSSSYIPIESELTFQLTASHGTSFDAINPPAVLRSDASRVQPQDPRPDAGVLPLSPTNLITLISQAALERADWNEMQALIDRYREEHREFLHRNDESARALQREKEQAMKVSDTAEAAFTKLEALRMKQEQRFEAEKQKAEQTLAEAQKLIEEKKLEDAAAEVARRAEEMRREAAERQRVADAEEAQRIAAQEKQAKEKEEEEKRQAAQEERRRKAAEEEEKRIAAEEEEKHKAAEKDRRRKVAEEQCVSAEEERQCQVAAQAQKEEERRVKEARKKAAEEQQRQAQYLAQRAELEAKKKKDIEKKAIAAHALQQEHRRSRPPKEEIQARLEKEKRAARSRSSTAPGVDGASTNPVDVETGRNAERTSGDSAVAAHAKALSGGDTLSGASALPASGAPSNSIITASKSLPAKPKLIRPNMKSSSTSGPVIVPSSPVSTQSSQPRSGSSIRADTVRGSLSNSSILPQVQTSQRVDQVMKPQNIIPVLPKTTVKPPSMKALDTSEPLIIKQEQQLDNIRLSSVLPRHEQLVATTSSSTLSVRSSVPQPRLISSNISQETTVESPNHLTAEITLAAETDKAGVSVPIQHPIAPSDETPPTVQTLPSSRTLSQHLSRGLHNDQPKASNFVSAAESDPWVNTPSLPDPEDALQERRSDSGNNDRSVAAPAYDHYSPPPPPRTALLRRDYDHYSSSPDRVVSRRERSPGPGRKRVRDNNVVWAAEEQPPPRRARFSPVEDHQQRRRAAAEPRAERMRSQSPLHVRAYQSKIPPPQDFPYWPDPYNGGYAVHAPEAAPRNNYYEERNSPPRYGNTYDQQYDRHYQPVQQDERRVVSPTQATTRNNNRSQPAQWDREDADVVPAESAYGDDRQSTLLMRISDSQSSWGTAPARSARNNRNGGSPPGFSQRGRGGSNNKSRGGNPAAARGGAGQRQRPLAARLTSGEGLGARLS